MQTEADILQKIHILRKQKQLTGNEVAARLGITGSTYNRLENGKGGLTLERLFKIAEILEIKPQQLIALGQPGNVEFIPLGLDGDDWQKNKGIAFDFPLIKESNVKCVVMDCDSLAPTIPHGEYIFVSPIESLDKVNWGEPYVIHTTDGGRIIRRIYPGELNKKYVRLEADNSIYTPFEIEPDRIKSLWHIIGRFTKSLSAVAYRR